MRPSTPGRSRRCFTRPSARSAVRRLTTRRRRLAGRGRRRDRVHRRRRRHGAPRGVDVILVRPFTEADDVAGFEAARGILTSEGGKASHAALVARGMGGPCVCGASELEIDLAAESGHGRRPELRAGDWIAIDGSTGGSPATTCRWSGRIEPRIREVLAWCRRPSPARRPRQRRHARRRRRAREPRCAGIGLCRTEHMFMAADRQPLMRRMILAADARERAARARRARAAPAGRLRGDLHGDAGLPVTIRLLDPPLHEFLPDRAELMLEIERLTQDRGVGASRRRGASCDRERARGDQPDARNPRLPARASSSRRSTRCRSGPSSQAALAVRDRSGQTPAWRSWSPWSTIEAELERMRETDRRDGRRGAARRAGDARLPVGTMIELPRACLVAGEIAARADFFSFGTNDLTQTTLGFSRDDAEGGFLATISSSGSSTRARSNRSTWPGSASWSGSRSSADAEPSPS